MESFATSLNFTFAKLQKDLRTYSYFSEAHPVLPQAITKMEKG